MCIWFTLIVKHLNQHEALDYKIMNSKIGSFGIFQGKQGKVEGEEC